MSGQVPYDYTESVDGEHGRIELRRVWCTSDIAWFEDKEDWAGLKSVVKVQRERTIADKTSTEIHYYISSLDGTNTKQTSHAIRSHWAIENSVHWVLDMAFREDESRIRKDNGPENFSLLRWIAHGLLKQEKSAKAGIALKRMRAGWDDDYLLKVLAFGFKDF